MAAALEEVKPVREYHDWVPVDRLTIPPSRYYSPYDEEAREMLKKRILEMGEKFSEMYPIIVNYALDSKSYIVRDGSTRANIFVEARYKRIYAYIREFERDVDAFEDAKWGSLEDNWHRGPRDPRQLIGFIRSETRGMPLRDVVKILVRRGFSRRYAYKLAHVARDDELSWKVIEGRLSLNRAIEIIEERSGAMCHMAHEKPGEGVVSKKEAPSRSLETTKISKKEISAKEPRKREISEKPKRGRPRKEPIPGLTAGLRDELKRAFKALGIEDESERTLLMSQAAEILGDYPVKTQMEAVKRWRESGGSISFQEALERVKKEEKAEEREEAEERVEEVSEVIKAEEVEREERKAVEELRKEAYSRFRAVGFKAKEAKALAETNVVEKAYEELGEHAGALLSKVASRAWARRRLSMLLDGKGAEESFKEVLEHMDEVYDEARNYFNRHLKTPSAEAGDVLLDLQGLVGGVTNVWMLEDGSYLILSKNPRVIVGQRRPFYQLGSSLETQVALANLGKSRIARKVDWIRAEVEIAKLEGEAPINLKIGRLGANAIICPNCGEPLRCMVCGSLVACSECGWPTTTRHKMDGKRLKEEALKGKGS